MTSKLTREQLIEELKRRILVTENYPDLEAAQIDAIICKIALAAMDSEPVAFTSLWALETKNQIVAFTDDMSALDYGVANGWKDIVELYLHAQPAPVVPEIDRKAIADKVYGKCSRIPGATFYNAAEFAIDEMEACRAAMLNGGKL